MLGSQECVATAAAAGFHTLLKSQALCLVYKGVCVCGIDKLTAHFLVGTGRRHPLSEKKIMLYMYQLCKSLDHMHRYGAGVAPQLACRGVARGGDSRGVGASHSLSSVFNAQCRNGIFHRDVKPENILVKVKRLYRKVLF